MRNDLSWIMTVMPWPPLMAQWLAFSFAILSDRRSNPLFPRWFGFLCIWTPIVLVPATMVPLLKSGPFAWNGLFTFWVPGIVFGVCVMITTALLLRAIDRPDTETVPETNWSL